jgi:XrtJ-associated TM-motif-TM protein
MKRFYPIVAVSIFLFFVALPLPAQGGCVDSPENPTLVLGIIGTAGAGIAHLYSRMKKIK